MSTSGEVRSKALAMLARRDFSRKELAQRLLRGAAKAQRGPRDGATGASKAGAGKSTDGKSRDGNARATTALRIDGKSAYGSNVESLLAESSCRVEAEQTMASSPELDAQTIEIALDALQAQGQLSDERFVESFLRSRLHRGQGPLRIRHELAQRGVDAELVDQHLTFPTAYWVERVAEVRTRRFGAAMPSGPNERNRQARFLAQRGFPADVIFAVLRGS